MQQVISDQEIEAKAEDFKVGPVEVEKDYVHGWLLARINDINYVDLYCTYLERLVRSEVQAGTPCAPSNVRPLSFQSAER